MKDTSSKRGLILITTVFFLLLIMLVINRPVLYRNFLQDEVPSQKIFSQIKFENVTKKVGVYPSYTKIHDDTHFMTPVVVLDVNNDGWFDIFLPRDKDTQNLLFINNKGQSFIESAHSYGLNFSNPSSPSAAIAYDYSGDGLEDLIIAYPDKLRFYKRIKDHGFTEDSSLGVENINQLVSSIAVADLQNDGEPDLVLGTYFNYDKTKTGKFNIKENQNLFLTTFRYNNEGGGRNAILYKENGQFRKNFDYSLANNTFTQAVGVSDVNDDGRPDIFFSNDYFYDQLFINSSSNHFVDKTNEFMPLLQHNLSGMNSEFYDFDRDGSIDLFVSNLFQKNFSHGGNVLWKKTPNGFNNVAFEKGVSDCGWAWGAKFGDFDNDGEDDLFVANGFFHTPTIKAPSQAKSFWFFKYEMSQVPRFLKRGFKFGPTSKNELSSFQRKCLFTQKNGHFYDIAKDAGIDNYSDRRTVAIMDFNNDGKLDLITRGFGNIELYKNVSKTNLDETNWIGFYFKLNGVHTVPFGAKLTFSLSNGKKIVRDLYPTNGYNVFNEARIHVGLGKDQIADDIAIDFPGLKHERKIIPKSSLVYNSYNEIKTGEK